MQSVQLVLHVGTGKTGTSTLQRALSTNRRLLLRHGILYPKCGRSDNHNALLGLCDPWLRNVPREYLPSNVDDGLTLAARGQVVWREIIDQVRESQPRLVILSGEYLFGQTHDALTQLHRYLSQVFSDMRVVAYVRHPASHYVAAMQQRVKASYRIVEPARYKRMMRPSLKHYLAVFDQHVRVRSFDSASLWNSCIICDFMHAYVPDGDDLAERLHVGDVNKSVSAEAMCILQDLRRSCWPDEDDVFTPESNRARQLLAELEPVLPQTPARLRPAISAAIAQKHQADIDWLQRRFRIQLPEPSGAQPDSDDGIDGLWSFDLKDILLVDREQIDRVLFGLLKELLAHRPTEVHSSRSTVDISHLAAPHEPARRLPRVPVRPTPGGSRPTAN
jgi:hypothetical protein